MWFLQLKNKNKKKPQPIEVYKFLNRLTVEFKAKFNLQRFLPAHGTVGHERATAGLKTDVSFNMFQREVMKAEPPLWLRLVNDDNR